MAAKDNSAELIRILQSRGFKKDGGIYKWRGLSTLTPQVGIDYYFFTGDGYESHGPIKSVADYEGTVNMQIQWYKKREQENKTLRLSIPSDNSGKR